MSGPRFLRDVLLDYFLVRSEWIRRGEPKEGETWEELSRIFEEAVPMMRSHVHYVVKSSTGNTWAFRFDPKTWTIQVEIAEVLY